MKNIFDIVHEDLFKPLTSKYRYVYADVIMLIYDRFRTEISYGVNREIVIKVLSDYFDTDDDEISFDDETYFRNARDKANGVVSALKNAGWLEYEQGENHNVNVSLSDYTIPIIEGMIRVVKEEETEYQGIISQIHASLQNDELYAKPYELIIMGVSDNTNRLLSELKRLSISIKKHIEKQVIDLDAEETLELFLAYHNEIGSKAYLRMKTADNISRFRSAIIEKIGYIMESPELMERAVAGYMEVEETKDHEEAYEAIISILMDIKSSFYRLDDIIYEIDRRHSLYLKNAVMRAKFLLSTGSNMEGRIERVLKTISEEDARNDDEFFRMDFSFFPQSFISPESMRAIPVKKEISVIDDIVGSEEISPEDRALRIEAMRQKNRRRFSKKNINQYVSNLLQGRERLPVTDIEVESKRDLIRIIYISVYAGSRSNVYRVERSDKRVRIGGYELPYFEIVKR